MEDGTRFRYDNAQGTSATGPVCDYVFPGKSDPIGYGVGGTKAVPVATTEFTRPQIT